MHVRTLLVLVCIGLNACATLPGEDHLSCDDQRYCSAHGRLEIFPGGYGGGTITVNGECIDLALPKYVLDEYATWSGKTVSLAGRSFANPRNAGMSWYDIQDRRVEGGGCSDRIIYVDTIGLKSHSAGVGTPM